MMLELHEAAVAITLIQVGPVLRQDVRVYVNLQCHASGLARLRHQMTALAAAAILLGPIESFEYRRQLSDDVGNLKVFLVELVITLFTEPQEAIKFTGQSLALDDEPDTAGISLW